mmetsp:Transcript_19497/g.44398  ORF Transcript_19497/g.44398 Transcript_19497/m.44398 type:complete len:325 (-) Transcript_19497:24-998(-)
MSRLKLSKRKNPDPDSEPNFYEISKKYPLPELDRSQSCSSINPQHSQASSSSFAEANANNLLAPLFPTNIYDDKQVEDLLDLIHKDSHAEKHLQAQLAVGNEQARLALHTRLLLAKQRIASKIQNTQQQILLLQVQAASDPGTIPGSTHMMQLMSYTNGLQQLDGALNNLFSIPQSMPNLNRLQSSNASSLSSSTSTSTSNIDVSNILNTFPNLNPRDMLLLNLIQSTVPPAAPPTQDHSNMVLASNILSPPPPVPPAAPPTQDHSNMTLSSNMLSPPPSVADISFPNNNLSNFLSQPNIRSTFWPAQEENQNKNSSEKPQENK